MRTTTKLRRARRQIVSGSVRVYGEDPEGWRHFPERSIMRLDALIEMQAELERLIDQVEAGDAPEGGSKMPQATPSGPPRVPVAV